MRVMIATLTTLIAVMLGYLIYVNWWPSGRGAVVVTSDPPGAQIWVDLKPTDAVTNGIVTGLTHGEHSVTVRLDTLMAEPFAQVVHVRTGYADSIHFLLRTPSGAVPVMNAATPVAKPLTSVLPDAAPLSPESLLASIPTAAKLRAADATTIDSFRSDRPRSDTVKQKSEPARQTVLPARPPAVETERVVAKPEAELGSLQISSSVPGALITMNDHLLSDRTPATMKVPFGTYTIQVELEGYAVTPEQQSVRIGRTSASPFVYFVMEKAQKAVRAFSVQTTPIEGRIFVDGILVGEGTAMCERDYGTYTVTFGEVEGWTPPRPVRVNLTPSKPHDELTVNYTRIYLAFAQIEGVSQVVAKGIATWTTGVIFGDGKPQPSESLGPKIREIPGSKKFGWELAMGDPNRNPTGGDYVAFTFTLPDDVSPDSPLNLRLYVYKTDHKYPFTLSGGRSDIIVTVNGRSFLDSLTPRYAGNAADSERYEQWSLHRVLKPGENQIWVYTGSRNTILNYLWKIEIL